MFHHPNRKRRPQRRSGKSRTKQDQKDSTDVNKIMARYAKTGIVQHINRKEPMYGDMTMATDLNSMMIAVAEAEDSFAELPAQVRYLADNDPVVFLGMLANKEQHQQLIEAGLYGPVQKPAGTAPPKDGEKSKEAQPPRPPAAEPPAPKPQEQTVIPGAE